MSYISSPMPRANRILPPFTYEDRDRHGNWRIYFRRKGQKKVRLTGMVGSATFMEQYKAALNAKPEEVADKRPSIGAKPETLRWLSEQYMKSSDFKMLKGTTPHTRRRILESIWREPFGPKESGLIYGDLPVVKFIDQDVTILMDRKAGATTAANDRRKVLNYLFKWAKKAYPALVPTNPVRLTERLQHKVRNVTPLTEDDFELLLRAYQPGSKKRRAIAFHIYTGARGCDVRNFGPQHVRDGRLGFTQQKTGGRVDIRILNVLAEEIALAPKDALAYILTRQGKTYSQKGYNTWINDLIRDAGVVGKTSHGIRAGAATMAANKGATDHQLMSMFGWLTEAEAIRYTKQANRVRLADSGSRFMDFAPKAEQKAS